MSIFRQGVRVIPRFRNIRPGGQISASEFNRAMDEIEKLTRIGVDPPLELRQDAAGIHLRLATRPGFWAKLTAKDLSGGGPGSGVGSGSGSGDECELVDTIWYSFAQVIDTGCGVWTTLTSGLTGYLTAFEANGLDVPLTINGFPTIVWMRFAPASDTFVFDAGSCCGGDSGSGSDTGSGDDDCPTSLTSFAPMTETEAATVDRLLVGQIDDGTGQEQARNILLKDLLKIAFKASPVYTQPDPGTGTIAFNLANGLRQQTTMEGDRVIALAGEFTGAAFNLRLIQDGTGGRVPTWFSGITWLYGAEPPVNTVAGAVTEFGFERTSAGQYRQTGYRPWLT